MKERLLAKLEELFKKYEDVIKLHDASKGLQQHDYWVQGLAIIDTIEKLQLEFSMSFPENKKEEMHAVFADILRQRLGDEKFEKAEKELINFIGNTEEQKKFYMFYRCPRPLIMEGGLREYFEKTFDQVDKEKLGKALDEIDNYKSIFTHNVKVYPWRERVAQLKKKNAERVQDAAKLKELNDELDEIAELIVTSKKEYSWYNGDERDKIFLRISNKRIDDLNEKSLKEDKYKHLNKYFNVYDDGVYQGSRAIHDTRKGDPNIVKDFNLDDAKIVIPKDTQDAIKIAINYMREKNMIPSNASAEEDGGKVYGFARLYDAQKKLSDAIETDDLEAIRQAKANYNQELENMRELYALIREHFNPDDNMLVGNLTTYRADWLPNEFKNDLVVNVYVSALFNLDVTLSSNGIDLDTFFADPTKEFFNVLKNTASKLAPNAHLSHDSITDAITTLSVGKNTGVFSSYGLPRNLEFLHSLTFHKKEFEQNALAMMLLQTYSIYITNLCYTSTYSKVDNYLDTNPVETIANIFLVNPEDRDYNRLKAFEDMSYDGMEKIPAFDTLGYLTSHNVPANELVSRIKNTVSELSKKSIKSKIGVKQEDMMLRSVKAAQLAAIQYLAVHPNPIPGVMSKSEYNALKQMAEKPEVAFAKSLDKELVTKIREERTYQKFNENGKQKLSVARKDARRAENFYSARVDSLKKKIDDLGRQMRNSKDDNDFITLGQEISKLESELRVLPGIEIARLEKEYLKGNLTKDYFDKRRQDLEAGNYKNTVPFGVDEYPSFNTFKEQYAEAIKNKTMTKAEVQDKYNRMIETARFAEKRFTLMNAANHPNPTLEETTSFTNALLDARAAAREAELIYKREMIDIEEHKSGVEIKIEKAKEKGQDTTELEEKLQKYKDDAKNLLNSELERLDKTYLEGLIPKDYYEQRKLDVQNGTHNNKVPFGTDEYPSFEEFKKKYAEDLQDNELTLEDVQFFYDRMMEDAQMTEANFLLVKSGYYPAPTLDAPEEVRYHIEVPELNEVTSSGKSPEVKQHENPVADKEIYP